MKRSITLLLLIFSLGGFSQTMTFNTGGEPGFSFSGWGYDAGLDVLYPNTPNVNWTGSIHRPSGCWNAISFNPQCFNTCNFPSGSTWRAFSDQGDEVFFEIPSNTTTYIDLNFYNINTFYLQLTEIGPGTPNQTFNFDNMIYELPSYTPAEAPTYSLSQNIICPNDAVSIIPVGNLNSCTNWVAYPDECGMGDGIFDNAGIIEIAPTETTTYYVRGEDLTGCTLPGPCTEVTVVVSNPDGCVDPIACNFDPAALCDDGSCIYAQWHIPLVVSTGPPILSCSTPAGYQLADQFCAQQVINNDPFCTEYTWDATCNHAYYCCLGIFGCFDQEACNYDVNACHDPDECIFPGCNNSTACNYDPLAGCDDGSCILPDGCTDAAACNYDNTAQCDDGNCTYTQWWIPTTVGLGPMISSCDPIPGYELANQQCAQNVVDLDPYCINNSWDAICNAAYNCCLGNYACHDPQACSYDQTLCEDVTLCQYAGCMDLNACNYDFAAGCDDGSCTYPMWYLPNTLLGGPALLTCSPPDDYYLADQACVQQIVDNDPYCVTNDWDQVCETAYQCCAGNCGCLDMAACNYDSTALYDDGTCTYPGCTTPLACNYDALAACDDGSCEYVSCSGCMSQLACNYDSAATIENGSCDYLTCAGCKAIGACNYDSSATIDDDSCEYTSCAGCTYLTATNYNSTSTVDDGTCLFESTSNCPGDFNSDGLVNTNDLLTFLGFFGQACIP